MTRFYSASLPPLRWESSSVRKPDEDLSIGMTVIVEFTVPSDGFELGRTLRMPDVEIQLFQLIPRGNRFVPYLWARSNEETLVEYEAALGDDDRINELETVERSDTNRLYRIDWATELNGLFAGFRRHELSIEHAKGNADSWRFRVFNRDQANLQSFQEYCADHDIPIDIGRAYHPNPPGEPPDLGLSTAQREALRTAYDQGYFEIPQQISLEELGTHLDISRQAATDRLNRGLQTLISQTMAVHHDEA